MDREANIESIHALEEEIEEHERAAIRLKRTRNSLLNVSKLPPEVLGSIFRWNVIPKGDFDGLEKESHNFLLVCHRWFQVASQAPELWSFWGNTPEDWSRWHRRSGTAPLDLVLGGYGYNVKYFDATLRDALEDRAAKGTIRSIHLAAGDTGLVGPILDSITPECEELRSSGIESFILHNLSKMPADISNFFAHHRFPKLQYLDLGNSSISSWDHLTSKTSALTTLKFDLSFPSSTPTTPQLLAILSSNPTLRNVALFRRGIPDDGGGKPFSRVQLHHLKKLRLDGDLRCVFNLLHQLDHPGNMDLLSLTLHNCDDVEVSQVVGPYLQDYLQRRDRAQNGLNLSVSSGYRTRRTPHVTLHLGNSNGTNSSDPAHFGTFVEITMLLNGKSHSVRESVVLDLVACIPRGEVVYINTRNNPVATEDTCAQFSNVKALAFGSVPLSAAFPNPNLAMEGKLFPPLECVTLERVDDDDWSPLVTFLASRASSGNRLDTLVINDSPSIPRDVVEGLRGVVRELKIKQQSMLLHPFDTGPDPF